MGEGKIFPERIQELRRKSGLTQAQLGEAVGLTQKAISTLEKGCRETSFDKLILLAKFFDVSTDYLLGLSDDPKPR